MNSNFLAAFISYLYGFHGSNNFLQSVLFWSSSQCLNYLWLSWKTGTTPKIEIPLALIMGFWGMNAMTSVGCPKDRDSSAIIMGFWGMNAMTSVGVHACYFYAHLGHVIIFVRHIPSVKLLVSMFWLCGVWGLTCSSLLIQKFMLCICHHWLSRCSVLNTILLACLWT